MCYLFGDAGADANIIINFFWPNLMNIQLLIAPWMSLVGNFRKIDHISDAINKSKKVCKQAVN